jgi:multiple sugar transport system permease protein
MAQGISARQSTVERKSQSSYKQKARTGRVAAPLKVRRAGGSGGSSPRGNTAGRPDSRSGQILYWAGGTVISAIFVLPLLFETLRSFQPESVVTEAPTAKTFGHLSLSNYQALLGGQDDILRNVINSLIVAVGAALLTALVATLAGYGFALFRFRGSGIVFGLVLVAFMIPFQAVLTPLFIEMHDLHLLNNLLGLALFYTTFNLPVGVYVMRNSFLQVPRELVDAARVDGASVMRTLTSVFRPLCMPSCSPGPSSSAR